MIPITEVRIRLYSDARPGDRLRAFATVTFDGCFVVRDLKVIEGDDGLIVAMPSRKVAARCCECKTKNPVLARFCNQCGRRLPEAAVPLDGRGRPSLYADVAHPISHDCRGSIEDAVLAAYEAESIAAALPGYVCRYGDYDVTPAPAEAVPAAPLARRFALRA